MIFVYIKETHFAQVRDRLLLLSGIDGHEVPTLHGTLRLRTGPCPVLDVLVAVHEITAIANTRP